MTTLVRKPPIDLEAHQVDEAFEQQCQSKLHYKIERKNFEYNSVARLLSENGYHPFDAKSVDLYKASMVRRAFWLKHAAPWFGLLFVLTMICATLTTWAVNAPTVGGTVILWGLSGLFCAASLTVTIGIVIDKFANIFQWKTILLRDATDVPKYALQTALDVSQLLQNHDIHAYSWRVDSLLYRPVETRQFKRLMGRYDPFLILEVDDDEFYMEVWDEPGFLNKRTV